jgi:uncharacterized protein YjdB
MIFKKRRYLWIGLFAALLTFTGLWKFYQVYAAAGDYNFFYEGEMDAAGNIELKTDEDQLIVQSKAGLEDPDKIRWETSDTQVVELVENPNEKMIVKLKRKGPGYSKITAIIEEDGRTYTLTCMVKVDFKVDKKNLPFKPLFTTDSTNSDENNVMVLGQAKGYVQDTVILKYADEDLVTSTMVWESKDSSVVSIDAVTGKITVEGAGETEIEVRTNTTLKEQPIRKTFKVIVEPKAKNPKDADTTHPFRDKFAIEEKTFAQRLVFETNAANASKLDWVVYDKDFKIAPEGRVTYSTDGSSFIVSGAKYGKYYIRGYIKNDYKPNPLTATATVGFIEIELNVLLNIDNTGAADEVVMNVGDTYSVPENSNIPSAGILGYSSDSPLIADVENNDGVIEAKSVGTAKIKLSVYGSNPLEEYYINVKVIDGIALNYSSVKIYTAGTVKLKEFVTNNSVPVVWSTDNAGVATVENGLVTGISQGTARITVSQTINGVIKSATCIVYVEPSVTKITLDPAEVSLNKQEKATVTATIEPNTLNNVSLKWMSSNENIVKIEKAYDLSATIQGLAAGTAVITAVNQENVVVGYCQVTVKERVSKVTLSDSAVTLSLAKKTYQLSAYVSPDTATNKKINWTSTNTKVATVDSNGLVTLITGGTTSIIAASDENPAATAMCSITVETPASSLILDEKTKEMNVGETYRLGYVITPTNAANKEVSWSSSNTAVASVDATGLIKAVAAGQAVITVKTADGTLTASCTITVKQKATGITLDATDLELYVNQSYELKATVTPASSTDYKLTWESSNSTVATVDDKGKVTAISAGRTTITVKTSTGQVAYCYITVKQQATGLQLNYKEKTIVIGEAFTIKATVVPSSAANEVSVNWSSSKTSVATVSANGEVKGIKGGTAIITCKTDDGKFTEFCVVTVVERVTSLTLNKSNVPVGLKKTYTLKATVKTNAATDPSIKWTSSNTRIASVDASGKVTGKAIGTVTITATAQDGSGEKDTCTVRVVRQATSLALSKTSVTTVEGRTFKLTANIKPSNATYKTVDWSSSDEKIAIVDSNGQVTALTEGNVTIKAESKDNSGKTATCFVIVQPRTPANSVTIINQNLTMVVGETATIQKAINPSASTDRVTWQSDNKTVASVDASNGKVTARTPGIASVTVMTESGKTATTKITVVGLNTTNLVLEQYSTYRLSVIGMTSGVTWDVDDNDIAVVSNGLVSSRRLGTTTITATVNGRRLTCRLQVVKIK